MPYKDPEARKKYYQAYHTRRGNFVRSRQKKWRESNSDKIWASSLRNNFGITPEQYTTMFITQNGVCGACGQVETAIHNITRLPKRLAVDHDHSKRKGESGFIRGLLCQRCNLIAGFADDRLGVLEGILGYLRKGARNEP